MKLSKSMRPFLSVVMIVSVVTFAPSVHCQEKTANDDPSFQFMAMHDLTKYAADATKWEQDVAKMTVANATEGDNEAILCLGSSSFRLWDTISADMAPYKIVRRAYGGAKYCDLAIHSPKLVDGLRFRAAMIFIANDITGSEKDKTPEEVSRLAKIVMETVRKQQPDVPIFLIAVTPTPLRFQQWPKIAMANKALEELASNEAKTFFVASQDKYLTSQGGPRPELFVKDMLHQNQEGYAIWSTILKDSLGKYLR